MNTQKKGTFSRWNESSARWYEQASAYTRYHEKLTEHIAPYLSPQASCCELACGTGALARHLAPLTASYTANDIDPQAVAFCRGIQSGHPLPNLEFLEGDWQKVFAGRSFDTVIFSYFGAVIRDWEALKKIASHQVIAVVPRYDKEEIRQKKQAFSDRSRFRQAALQNVRENRPASDRANETEKSGGEKKKRPFETMEAIVGFLSEKGVSFETIPLTLEFGQPCRTLEEAEEYVKYYYRFETEEERKEFVRRKFQPADCGYFFSKKKNIGIVVIDMTSA